MKLSKTMASCLLASCLFQVNAQSQTQQGLKTVTAGDTISFDVGLDKAPQVSGGQFAVLVCPINPSLHDEATSSGAQFSRVSSTSIIANQGQYSLSVQIPGDAPDAVWEAFFSYALPNGNFRELHHAEVEFRVQHRKYPELPHRLDIASITVHPMR
jgi:hypothetical protein